jgi:tetrahydromethanopterin S-methyltransferase subunit F
MDRLTKVEASLQHIEADIDDMKSCVEDVKKAVDNFQTAKTVTKGQIVTAVASMVATLVMSLWAVLAQIMKP